MAFNSTILSVSVSAINVGVAAILNTLLLKIDMNYIVVETSIANYIHIYYGCK
jgi:hypothetical protein